MLYRKPGTSFVEKRRGHQDSGKQCYSCDESLKFKVTTCLFNRTKAPYLKSGFGRIYACPYSLVVCTWFSTFPGSGVGRKYRQRNKSDGGVDPRARRRTHTTTAIGFRNVKAAPDSRRPSSSGRFIPRWRRGTVLSPAH